MHSTITLQDAQRRDELIRGGWGWPDRDDDLPNPPTAEPDDLSSAQARRAWRQTTSAD